MQRQIWKSPPGVLWSAGTKSAGKEYSQATSLRPEREEEKTLCLFKYKYYIALEAIENNSQGTRLPALSWWIILHCLHKGYNIYAEYIKQNTDDRDRSGNTSHSHLMWAERQYECDFTAAEGMRRYNSRGLQSTNAPDSLKKRRHHLNKYQKNWMKFVAIETVVNVLFVIIIKLSEW